MRRLLRSFLFTPERGNNLGLELVLAVLVLVPLGCLLWFMNQAAQNERLAVRQKLLEAYRGHLALAQARLADTWRRRADELDAAAETNSAVALFANLVRAGQADAAVCFDAKQEPAYPDSNLPLKPDLPSTAWAAAEALEATAPLEAARAFAQLAEQATNVDLCARALQAQARCWLEAGNRQAALAVLTGPLAESRFAGATDAQGRALAMNTDLLAIELLKSSTNQGDCAVPLARLKKCLLDYEQPGLSAPQRRFLMRRVQMLHPDPEISQMLAAEDLAAAYIESGANQGREPVMRPTTLPGLWQFASTHGRVITLFRHETLLASVAAGPVAQMLPGDLALTLLPPGKESEGLLPSVPVSVQLPGWRLALALKSPSAMELVARQRVTSYVWVGVCVVATVAIMASLALGMVRRQMALSRLRNDLVANVTHELKTPLASMRLLVDTLLNSDSFHGPTLREYLQLIARENLRLSRLIANFLAFSRMERNKYAFEFRELSPAELIQNAEAAVHERFQTAGVGFRVSIPSDLPPVMADLDAMTTALVNLLDNAYKYTSEDKQITLGAVAENGVVRLTVTDNGIGLSARDTRRIFKRFVQVNGGSSRSAGGCGLGLSIVEFIARAHQGSVAVQSEPGRGSTFTISLPTSRHSAVSSVT